MGQAKLPISDVERELAAGYILGDLDPEELRQFEARLSGNALLQAEVHALRVSLMLMPQGLEPVVPPPQLRDRVLAAQALASVARRRKVWPVIMTGMAVLVALLAFDNLRLRRDLSVARGLYRKPSHPFCSVPRVGWWPCDRPPPPRPPAPSYSRPVSGKKLLWP